MPVYTTHIFCVEQNRKCCPQAASALRYLDGVIYPDGASCPMLPDMDCVIFVFTACINNIHGSLLPAGVRQYWIVSHWNTEMPL